MPSNRPKVCVPCREVFKDTYKCPRCGNTMVVQTYRWRAPKKNNDAAWKLIEQGIWLWDKKALAKIARLDPRSAAWRLEALLEQRRVNPKWGRSLLGDR